MSIKYITHQQYLDAVDIVTTYWAQMVQKSTQEKSTTEQKYGFQINDKVRTANNTRAYEPFIGEVVGFSKWRHFDRVVVKKNKDGKKVLCDPDKLVKLP